MKLIKHGEPEKCVLQVTAEELAELTTAPTEVIHQKLLGAHIVQHLKDHHNYGSSDPEKPPINLAHEVVAPDGD